MKFLLLTILMACSSMSEKQILNSNIKLRGGRVGSNSWKETLKFKRTSWYQGLKLEYDSYLVQIDKNSQFRNWFSTNEKSVFKNCETIVLSLVTNNFHEVILNSEIDGQMASNSFTSIAAPNFLKNLKVHPDYSSWNLTMYAPKVFCSAKSISSIDVIIPSYDKVSISL